MSNSLTYEMVKNYQGNIHLLRADLKSFVHARSERTVQGDKITYIDVPELKNNLILKLIEMRNHDVKTKVHTTRPLAPV